MLDELREAIDYINEHKGLIITCKFRDGNSICYGEITSISETVGELNNERNEKLVTINVTDTWTKLNRVFVPEQMYYFDVVQA